MALFPYGIPKTEKKATSDLDNWESAKQSLLVGLSGSRKDMLNTVLDNQRQYLTDPTADTQNFRNIMIPMIRQILPGTIAQNIIGVQPMFGPVGSIHTIRHTYVRDIKNILVTITKFDFHWHCFFDIDGELNRIQPITEWIKETMSEDNYWIYNHDDILSVNVYDEESALAISLRWHNAK